MTQPRIDSGMIIGRCDMKSRYQPTSVLTPLHRDLQRDVFPGFTIFTSDDQIMFRLVCSVLNRYMKAEPGKLSGGKGFSCDTDIMRVHQNAYPRAKARIVADSKCQG